MKMTYSEAEKELLSLPLHIEILKENMKILEVLNNPIVEKRVLANL